MSLLLRNLQPYITPTQRTQPLHPYPLFQTLRMKNMPFTALQLHHTLPLLKLLQTYRTALHLLMGIPPIRVLPAPPLNPLMYYLSHLLFERLPRLSPTKILSKYVPPHLHGEEQDQT